MAMENFEFEYTVNGQIHKRFFETENEIALFKAAFVDATGFVLKDAKEKVKATTQKIKEAVYVPEVFVETPVAVSIDVPQISIKKAEKTGEEIIKISVEEARLIQPLSAGLSNSVIYGASSASSSSTTTSNKTVTQSSTVISSVKSISTSSEMPKRLEKETTADYMTRLKRYAVEQEKKNSAKNEPHRK